METGSLYDLTPIAWLMAAGVLIALGPLVWVWRRNAGAGPARRLVDHAIVIRVQPEDVTVQIAEMIKYIRIRLVE